MSNAELRAGSAVFLIRSLLEQGLCWTERFVAPLRWSTAESQVRV